MTLAVLTINDQALQLFVENGEQRTEVGYVNAAADGLISGEAARDRAWLQPQFSFNQYWQRLDQKPLETKLRWARSNADMAFAQVRQLLSGIQQPELLLAVPGSLQDEQLSLLLGLLKALPANVIGVVDNALLTAKPVHRAIIDLQLHQVVVTQLKVDGDHLCVHRHEVLSDLGAVHIHRDIGQYISHQLITDTRYDPLHSSNSQQALYTALPDWLSKLSLQTDWVTEIDSPQGPLPLRLDRLRLQQLLAPRYKALEHALRSYANPQISTLQTSALLTTLSPALAAVVAEKSRTFADRGFALAHRLKEQKPPLERILKLAYDTSTGLHTPTKTRRAATHLLFRQRAWCIGTVLSLKVTRNELDIQHGAHSDADLLVSGEPGKLQLTSQNENLTINAPNPALAGDCIQVGDYSIELIEVMNA